MTRGFAPVHLLGDSDDHPNRIFVELWDTKDWPDMLTHLETLRGVSCVTSHEAGPDSPGLTFTYGGHKFSFHRGCGDYVRQREDMHCAVGPRKESHS